MASYVGSENPGIVDKLLWVVVLAIVVGALGSNYYFSGHSLLLRVVGLLLSLGLVFGIALQTCAGRKAWILWQEALQEVRKVHWPTRQETMQTTMIVLAMVVVMGILLWSADFALLRIVKWLTGHWGV